MASNDERLSEADQSRVIEMAWEDRTPFEAIEAGYGLSEQQVIELMRRELKASSFRLWRKRVSGRRTKHRKLRPEGVDRAYCPTQYKPR
jgi:uncharacterized protein (TIGR03643 family)